MNSQQLLEIMMKKLLYRKHVRNLLFKGLASPSRSEYKNISAKGWNWRFIIASLELGHEMTRVRRGVNEKINTDSKTCMRGCSEA